MATIYLFIPNDDTASTLEKALKQDLYDVARRDADERDAEWDQKPALALIDASLRWSSCRALFERLKRADCPVLFITSDRRMSAHLRALYPGRSDVLTLPVSARTMRAKAQALITEGALTREISVDEKSRVATLDGRRIELTAQELSLLMALLEMPDTPVSREQLLRKAWGYQSMGETRTVDVHVQRLRKKLGGEYIETVYKCGYRLRLA